MDGGDWSGVDGALPHSQPCCYDNVKEKKAISVLFLHTGVSLDAAQFF